MYKRLNKIVNNYQYRLKQLSHFMLLMFYKTSPLSISKSKGLIQRQSSESRALAYINRPENQEKISRAMTPLGLRLEGLTPIHSSTPINDSYANGNSHENSIQIPIKIYKENNECIDQISISAKKKLTEIELKGINQLGAIQIIFIQFKNIKTRLKAIGLISLYLYYQQTMINEHERINYIEQIHNLRCQKETLMEDNLSLRKHNEILIENLEQSNFSFQAISIHLDNMKIIKMIKILGKMVEVSMLEIFILIKK